MILKNHNKDLGVHILKKEADDWKIYGDQQ